MTKKHYEAFARRIKAHLAIRDNYQGSQFETLRYAYTVSAQFAADMVAEVAKLDNPHFDRERFMRACGL